MPVFKQRVTFEVARNIKAFYNLNLGITRGKVPDFEQRTFKQDQNHTKRKNRQLERMRERLTNKDQRIRTMQEQLATDGYEIGRLHHLIEEQAEDRRREIAELKRQQFESASDPEICRQNGRGSFSKDSATDLYLDLMKRSLKHEIYDEPQVEGKIWPTAAHTMIGLDRLNMLQFCVEDVLANDVPGDLIETGVWRGGATIFMRAILKAYGVEDRHVWVADSFEGLPSPEAGRYPHDAESNFHTFDELAISLEQVKSNFERYGLLDDRVRFLKGWFSDTLPEAPIERLAVVRLDGDMYESTMDALVNLYPKLSVGGYLIVDDYGAVPACRQAIHDYREAHDIHEEIQSIDYTGVFWQRAE